MLNDDEQCLRQFASNALRLLHFYSIRLSVVSSDHVALSAVDCVPSVTPAKLTMRKAFSKFLLEQRPPASGRVEIRDAESPLVIRISPTERAWCVRTRIERGGAQVRVTCPIFVSIENLPDARKWARETVDRCKQGDDPRTDRQARLQAKQRAVEAEEQRRFGRIVDLYIDRRVRREKQNRTSDAIERSFQIYFLPRWRDRCIIDISRADVNTALDAIFDRQITGNNGRVHGGPVAADRALAQLAAMFRWWETQDDQFRSPIVRGMTRTNPVKLARDRVLDDEEIRALWKAVGATDDRTQKLFGKLVNLLLLTAARRDEISGMQRSEIGADGIWVIPSARYKTGLTHALPVTEAMRAVLDTIEKVGKSDLVFTTNGKTQFQGFSKGKVQLDRMLLAELRKADPEAEMKPWRLHDLRRTARTLMARAGVSGEIAERVLGHSVGGIEGVYNRYDYLSQKKQALEALAGMIDRIVGIANNAAFHVREAAE